MLYHALAAIPLLAATTASAVTIDIAAFDDVERGFPSTFPSLLTFNNGGNTIDVEAFTTPENFQAGVGGLAKFDLSSAVTFADLTGATLTLNVIERPVFGATPTVGVLVGSIANDAAIGSADLAAPVALGDSREVSDLGPITFDLDLSGAFIQAAFAAALDADSSLLVAYSPSTNTPEQLVRIDTIEGAAAFGLPTDAPTLTLTFVPEPASALLLASGGMLLLSRRRTQD